MSVKLVINLEMVDYERARALMAAIVGVVADGTKGGDKSKLGFQRKVTIGNRTREVKDTIDWIFGEPAPTLEELGFTKGSAPMDLLLGMERPSAPGGVTSVRLGQEHLDGLNRAAKELRAKGRVEVAGGDLEPWRGVFGDDEAGDGDDEA